MKFALLALVAFFAAAAVALDDPTVASVTAVSVATDVDSVYGNIDVARAASYINYGDRVFVLKGARVATAAINGYPAFRADAFRWALSTLAGVRQTFGYFSIAAQAEAPAQGTTAPSAELVTADVRTAWFGAADAADAIQEVTAAGAVVGTYNLHDPLLQWDSPVTAEITLNDAAGASRKIHTLSMSTSDGVFTLQSVWAESRFDWTTEDGIVLHLRPDAVARRILIQWYNPNHVAASWTPGPSANDGANANNQIRIIWHQARAAGVGVASETTPTAAADFYQQSVQLPYTAYWAWSAKANVSVGTVATVGAVAAAWRAPTAAEQTFWGAAWAVRVGVTTFTGSRPDRIVWSGVGGIRVFYDQLVSSDLGSSTRVVGPETVVARSYSATDSSITLRAAAVSSWPPVNPRFVAIAAGKFDAQRTTNNIDAQANFMFFVFNTIGRVEFSMAYLHADARAELPDPSTLDNVPGDDTQTDAVTTALRSVEATFSASAVAGSLRLLGLLCYRDNNGNNDFDPIGDDNLGYYLFNLFTPWKPMARQTVPVMDADSNEFEATIFTFETADEVLTIRSIYSPIPAKIEGRDVTPDTLKFDVRINYFNNPLNVRDASSLGKILYTNNAPPDTETGPVKLALCGGVGAAGGQFSASFEGTDPSTRWYSPDSPTIVQTSWASSVEYRATPGGAVTTGSVNINLVDPSNDTNVKDAFAAQLITGWSIRAGCWTFPGTRPNDIYWDPTIGASVNYAATSNCDPSSGTCSCPLSQASCGSGETFYPSICQCATSCPIKASDCAAGQPYYAAECRCTGASLLASLLLLLSAVLLFL